jgi:hypothetical protein
MALGLPSAAVYRMGIDRQAAGRESGFTNVG